MTRRWLFTLPIFSTPLVVCSGSLLTFEIFRAMTVDVIGLTPFAGVFAAIWMGNAASLATTDSTGEYLLQLPTQRRRLLTLIVDVGFGCLIGFSCLYLALEFSGVFDHLAREWLPVRSQRPRLATDFERLRRLDLLVESALAYWVVIAMRLSTRKLAPQRAFLLFVLELLGLVGVAGLRMWLMFSGVSITVVQWSMYAVLTVAALSTFALRRRCRAVIRGDSARLQRVELAA